MGTTTIHYKFNGHYYNTLYIQWALLQYIIYSMGTTTVHYIFNGHYYSTLYIQWTLQREETLGSGDIFSQHLSCGDILYDNGNEFIFRKVD